MRIAIIGAGVSGLTCGVVLSEAGHEVTIFAKEIEDTTSHAAAAIWFPYHIASEHAERWAEETRGALIALTGEPGAGVSMIDFDVNGETFRVPLMDTTRYLPYLRRRVRGDVVQRELTREMLERFARDHDVIVNCAGFGARELFGDDELVPGYGIAVIADRPAIERAVVTDEPLMYVIPRTGDCILGGYDSPLAPPESEVDAIVARCRAAVPAVNGQIRGVKQGIRPVRPSVRLERTELSGTPLIHNYGHGGAGFTVSWGCAWEVGRMVEDRRSRLS
ncbi:MAG TPA: FAD-dependent oxidoreductase [Thermoanaerobaculia bacterium]|nr:FAD-dependent oxidoreductase [Thermoanaerobaculia bacterium]